MLSPLTRSSQSSIDLWAPTTYYIIFRFHCYSAWANFNNILTSYMNGNGMISPDQAHNGGRRAELYKPQNGSNFNIRILIITWSKKTLKHLPLKRCLKRHLYGALMTSSPQIEMWMSVDATISYLPITPEGRFFSISLPSPSSRHIKSISTEQRRHPTDSPWSHDDFHPHHP